MGSVLLKRAYVTAGVLLLVFACVVLQNAWVCDDAFITWRTIDHFVGGRGPVYNVGERVQAYTHPLWMFLLAALHVITREAWWTTVFASVAVSVAAVYVVAAKLTRPDWVAVPILTAMILSRAFVEYSASGLENPLAHLVVAWTCWVYFRELPSRRSVRLTALGFSLGVLTRPDLALVLAPLWFANLRHAKLRGVPRAQLATACLIGLAPLVAWEAFSVIYYGALVPNTAYAKLATGIPRMDLLAHGAAYVQVSFEMDPLTPFTIALGLLVIGWRRDRRAYPLRWSIGLYLAYLVWIGGDFMAGRFLTVPFLLALIGLGRLSIPSPRGILIPMLGIAGLTALSDRPPPFTTADDFWTPDQRRSRLGVSDERSFYARGSSVLAWESGRSFPEHPWVDMGIDGPRDGSDVAVFSTIGFYGYHAREDLYIVDEFALADPFLARLPSARKLKVKPGHIQRGLPRGYVKTRKRGENVIKDPKLADLYDAIVRVHQGPIWDSERFVDIARLHTGHYTSDLDPEQYQYLGTEHIRFSRLRRGKKTAFKDRGIFVDMGPAQTATLLELEASTHHKLELRFYLQGRPVGSTTISREKPKGIRARPISVPPSAQNKGFDQLHLIPLTRGKKSLFIQRLELIEEGG
jgi:arabinofuranosyltransferase